MTVGPTAYVVGVAAALRAPVSIRGSGMTALLKDPGPLGPSRGDPAGAVRVALGALRLLARARLPCWRNTCLYRAVAECIVQRGYGIPCRVELGVTPPGEGAAIAAHAWVVCEDGQTAPAAAGMIVLR